MLAETDTFTSHIIIPNLNFTTGKKKKSLLLWSVVAVLHNTKSQWQHLVGYPQEYEIYSSTKWIQEGSSANSLFSAATTKHEN